MQFRIANLKIKKSSLRENERSEFSWQSTKNKNRLLRLATQGLAMTGWESITSIQTFAKSCNDKVELIALFVTLTRNDKVERIYKSKITDLTAFKN